MEYFIFKLEHREIATFLDKIFEIYDIRGRVGKVNGISFIIHTNEQNHPLPHVHASYGEFAISIEIKTGKVLEGNLPPKNTRLAVNWVLSNKEKLLTDWSKIALSATAQGTASQLSRN